MRYHYTPQVAAPNTFPEFAEQVFVGVGGGSSRRITTYVITGAQ